MENILWKILAFIIMVYLIVLMPLLFTLERQENIMEAQVLSFTQEFSDVARDSGIIYDRDIVKFQNKLAMTGQRYKISYEYIEKTYIPLFDALNQPAGTRAVYINESEIDFLDCIKNQSCFKMAKGDFFYVTVESTSWSFVRSLKKVLIGVDSTVGFYARGGGLVRNEDY